MEPEERRLLGGGLGIQDAGTALPHCLLGRGVVSGLLFPCSVVRRHACWSVQDNFAELILMSTEYVCILYKIGIRYRIQFSLRCIDSSVAITLASL